MLKLQLRVPSLELTLVELGKVAFGSLVALAVIGVLLILGAQHWRRNALQS